MLNVILFILMAFALAAFLFYYKAKLKHIFLSRPMAIADKELVGMYLTVIDLPLDQKLRILNALYNGAELATTIRHTPNRYVIESSAVVSDKLLEEREASKQDDYIQ